MAFWKPPKEYPKVCPCCKSKFLPLKSWVDRPYAYWVEFDCGTVISNERRKPAYSIERTSNCIQNERYNQNDK
jgi:hypothetical protein